MAAGRQIHASLYGRIAAGAENPDNGPYHDEVAVVTGASKGSIAASVVGKLLDGGATVIATTSKLDDERLGSRALPGRSVAEALPAILNDTLWLAARGIVEQ